MLRRNAMFLLGFFAATTLSSCKKPTPAGPSVKLYVDEAEIATVPVSESPIVLASLLKGAAADPAAWKRLEGRAGGGRFLDVRQPYATYQNGEARLYLQQGQPALGIFRPVRDGLPEHIAKIARQPAVSINGIVDVRVYTKDPPPVVEAELVVEATGLPSWTMVADDLEELPEFTDGSARARGRTLADIARSRVTGTIERVVIEARDGGSHAVSAAALDDKTKPLLVKVNNKNQWVFKAWANGAADAEVRDLVKLRIEGPDLKTRGGDGSGRGGGGGRRLDEPTAGKTP